ncbi:glutathione S-transferase family protein [Roseicyclus sp. F158]|uniref:Glutathione S-transferase family protein n=1 Tax=Tropicimonas omnivorans TaxID=3075590 RepID=A0ABU3DFZ0_9RHOB|nr:glutathione S-transferase family protein [Roseicyclus sp. F158]MDT0682607.1 glutathione S-transferase family protein [Roseicyclus sp. F158]
MIPELLHHPLDPASHAPLFAAAELGAAVSLIVVDLADAADRGALAAIWPHGTLPVLRDPGLPGGALGEASIIVERLDTGRALLPAGRELEVRMWERRIERMLTQPTRKIVEDRLRRPGTRDLHGVGEARRTLSAAYDALEAELAPDPWIFGDRLTLADIVAGPALFFADTVVPLMPAHPALGSYLGRLMTRTAYGSVLAGAKPWFPAYPMDQKPSLDTLRLGDF